jgi:hypothetical protein
MVMGTTPPLQVPESDKSATTSFFGRAKAGIKSLLEKYEKYVAVATFVIGFLWDSLTMTRVDNLIDNVILLFYLILIGAMIVFTLRRQFGMPARGRLLKLEPYFPWAMQFCFGGLFSSYVVFYFKSASFTRTQFFFLILVFLLLANEFLHHRLQNPVLLAVLYTFCLLSFLAFSLPVLLAAVNEWIFLLAGSISLLASLFVFSAGMLFHPKGWIRQMKSVALWILSVVLVVNILYFFNLIPPVPLALKDVGIFHNVTKMAEGYEVEYVASSSWRFWVDWESPFYLSAGDRVYCYTAIFAPGRVHIPIFHVWLRKTKDGWVQTDRIQLDISGGREKGYRGYTYKRGVAPGKWRVAVETRQGQTLGEITFDVLPSPVSQPHLKTALKR